MQVVWKITDGKKGMNELQQWLINIQARAPNSPVVIVGTHLDEVKVKMILPSKLSNINEMRRSVYSDNSNWQDFMLTFQLNPSRLVNPCETKRSKMYNFMRKS